MDRAVLCALLRVFMFMIVQMIPAAAAEIVCNVTRLRDDLYKYQLSSPSQCKMGWEDVNKTAYAHEFVFDPDRVDNVTRDYIVLKSCQDYMHFTDDCLKHDAVQEVHCRVNCTLLSSLPAICCIVVCIRRRAKCRRGGRMETTAYTAANVEIKMQMI
ncbi:hypothetical protein D9C73_009299 [Collichthys lucidus]|uniref:Uncharacterized protein n=1 Tax=Collichthys lucidus TaxID=240159 RepID=A0A4U5UNX6_COLLU|nr:hypothetical protein D9C73_009299 [Collichthys lucidus]